MNEEVSNFKNAVVGEYLNTFLVKKIFREKDKWRATVECPVCGADYTGIISILSNKKVKCCRKCSQKSIPIETRQTNIVHGLKNHPLYYILRGMKSRCYNSKDKSYPKYGAKGIKVCEDWFDISKFHSWCMDNGWEKGLHIDRIISSGDYCPENCRIVKSSDNNKNKVLEGSKYQGVFKSGGTFTTQLKSDGKTLFRRRFSNEMDAVIFRDNYIREHNLIHVLNILNFEEIKSKIFNFYDLKDFIYGNYLKSKSFNYEDINECFQKTGLGEFSEYILKYSQELFSVIIDFKKFNIFIKIECKVNPYGELIVSGFDIKEVFPKQKTVTVFN